MKKETGFAIFLGILFGVVVAVGLIFKTRQEQLQKTKAMSSVLNITPTITLKASDYQPLEISEPEDGAIVDAKSITITGKASKNSLIIIQSPIKNIILENKEEEFSTDFPLAFGENLIHISVYTKDSQTATQEKDLVVNNLDEQ